MASELLRKVLNYSVTDINQQDGNGNHSNGLHNEYPGDTGGNVEEVCCKSSFQFVPVSVITAPTRIARNV